MKVFIKITVSAFLIFNGIGAIYGGWNLIMHPDGSSIQLSIHWLQHTPFDNYFIPGIILFIMNGLFSILVFILFLMDNRYKAWLVIAQGAVLTGWIVIQVLLIRTVYFLHILLIAVGLILIILGLLLKNKNV